MKRNMLATAFLAAFVTASSATAGDATLGAVTVSDAYTFETAQTARTGGGFMEITNHGPTADRLLAVEADFPRVEVHTTEMDGDIARMMHVDAVDLPAGETVTFQPGSYHVMFMGLNGDPFEVGETVPATLIFENAGRLDVVFTVKARGMDGHGAMMQHGENG